MVEKRIIEEVISKSVEIIKCHDYPKAVALRDFDEKDYSSENYPSWMDTETLPSPVGSLQSYQASLQDEIEYESLEKGSLHDYSTDSFIPLNMMLNGVPDWEDRCEYIHHIELDNGGFAMPVLDETLNDGGGGWATLTLSQEITYLDSAIDKSPRVAENSIVYRYGELPIDIQAGQHGRFKGYLSTSYNEWVAFKDIPEGGTWIQIPNYKVGVRYKQRIFVPTGTKGVVLNRHTGCKDWQSELLLGRNQRYVVLNVDNENMTADILLY